VATKQKLVEENVALERFLPRTLSVAEIVSALASVAEQIKAAPNQGPAMGVAMKVLKASGAEVNSADVTQAIAQLRA
jgi:uncharacterized protein